MKPVPHGEPYAGKLHVRFDEGAGVPDNKGRSALLYKRALSMLWRLSRYQMPATRPNGGSLWLIAVENGDWPVQHSPSSGKLSDPERRPLFCPMVAGVEGYSKILKKTIVLA